MNMNDYERKYIEDFFKAIEANLPGYQHAVFSYVALRNGNAFELSQGRLRLQGEPLKIPSSSFQSDNIRAGILRLSELELGPRDFVESLCSGKLRTPHGDLLFPSEPNRSHSVHFSPYHMDGASTQSRQIQLHLSGDRRQRIESALLDWELKAAPTPFFDVQEICDAFLVGKLRGESVSIELIAFNVAAVSVESSIEGVRARLAIILAEGLATDKAALGYRVFERGRVARRGQMPGSTLKWTKVGEVLRGIGEIEVPSGAVIDCTASYAGAAQNHYWIADPKTAQNPFRSVHQTFDNNLEVLRELIARSQTKGANARDLEIATSWVLWMLGFSATHIGGTPKTADAPDLVASTPKGDLVVIECTTGILKEDSKLSHLYQRAEKVRQNLAASGNQHLRVLPVIVTTKTRDEIKSELGQAHKLGVLVATREDFQGLIDRTMLIPNPNGLYAEAEEAVRRLQNPSPLAGFSDVSHSES